MARTPAHSRYGCCPKSPQNGGADGEGGWQGGGQEELGAVKNYSVILSPSSKKPPSPAQAAAPHFRSEHPDPSKQGVDVMAAYSWEGRIKSTAASRGSSPRVSELTGQDGPWIFREPQAR